MKRRQPETVVAQLLGIVGLTVLGACAIVYVGVLVVGVVAAVGGAK